jgi:His/Glu/Gln/Arg/opine family amino acid ABC transporter permease subunit
MDWAFTQRIVGNLADGLVMTVIIVAASMILGNLLALPVALARVSPRPYLWVPAYLYILVMRGTPLIVQMYIIYYGLGQFPEIRRSFLWPVLRDPVWCAIISLSLNTAAYSGEVLRGSIMAVPQGLVEAGKAVGLRDRLVFLLIVLPTAIRQALPAFANETVLLLKASAIVFTITVRDIMGEANIIRSQTFRVYEPLVTAALLYLVLTVVIVQGFSFAERRLNVHRRKPDMIEMLAGVR